MKPLTIWAVAIAICLVPLGWLSMRNPRAVPVGALLVVLVAWGGMGALAVGGAGAGRPDAAVPVFAAYVGGLVVLGGLAGLNVYLMKGALSDRLNWAVVSMVIWLGLTGVLNFARSEAASEARTREIIADRQRIDETEARHREALDRMPERRRVVLDRALALIQPVVTEHYRKFDHFVVFGDAAKAPETVVVWAVIVPRPEYPSDWQDFWLHAEHMHHLLNEQLRRAGYPARIAMGFAPANAVAAAGGDDAYFGAKGETFVPQFPAEHRAGQSAARPPFDYPKRRGV